MATVEKPQEASGQLQPQSSADEYPSPSKRVVIMIALYLSIFLVTLDQNIIATAIPRITDEFHSLDDIGWYSSAYLLTSCTFQLLMGKVYRFYPAKPIFLICIFLFEVGSAVCGSAPSSIAFIIGRAIAGIGASGLFSGLMVAMVYTIPLQQRPIYQGLFGAVFALGSVVGPLLGGTFVDKLSWRWCFYINLPIGAFTIIVVGLILRLPNQKLEQQGAGWWGKIKQLDPLGNLVFFPGIVCLILALQWGGTIYAWNNARIIVLFVLFAFLVLAFGVIQYWKQDAGTVPPRIIKNRSIAGSIWFTFFNGAGMMVVLYYLPLYFQAVKGVTALRSGIMLLPIVLSSVAATISSGIIISKVGYYTQFFIICSVLTPVATALISTFTPNTGAAKWIGYQIFFGIANGFGMQQPMNVVQTVLPRQDVSTGTAIIFFVRFMGPSIFVPVANNIFVTQLTKKLVNLPGISASSIANGGATAIRSLVSPDELGVLLLDYNNALKSVFYMATAMCAVTILGSVFVEWKSLKKVAAEQAQGNKAVEKEILAEGLAGKVQVEDLERGAAEQANGEKTTENEIETESLKEEV